jgi:hypothetical protein
MEDAAVDLWATDEVHFQQHGSRCRMWVPPETKDPVLLHHPTRRSVGYFGAVRLRDGKFQFSRETGKFNAVTFWAFLKGLRVRPRSFGYSEWPEFVGLFSSSDSFPSNSGLSNFAFCICNEEAGGVKRGGMPNGGNQ